MPGNAADHTTAVTVVLSEPGTFTCALDGAPVACADSFTLLPPAEGQHALTVTATDLVGNSADSSATFLADWTAPVVAALDDLEVVADARRSAEPSARRRRRRVRARRHRQLRLRARRRVQARVRQLLRARHDRRVVRRRAMPAATRRHAVTFSVTVVCSRRRRPPTSTWPTTRTATASRVTESHGGTIDWVGRRTLTAAVDDHETRVNLRRTDDVAGVDHLDDGLRVQYLRYDGGERLRPTSNGYAFSSPERHDGSHQAARDRRPRRAERRDREVLGRRATSRSCATSTCRSGRRYASSASTDSSSPTFAATPAAC